MDNLPPIICQKVPNWDDVTVAGACPSGRTFDACTSASRFVNPIIGASTSVLLGEGKTFPGPTTPFGMVQLSPDTITGGVEGLPNYSWIGDNGSGYSYEQTTIEGFSFTHMSGVGAYGDLGNLQVIPTTGPMKLDSGRVDHPHEGWRSRYSHANERAEANYYAVTLERYGIRAELAAAPRAGMLQFTFPQTKTARIQLNLARRIGGSSTRQYVEVVGERAIESWMPCPSAGGGWENGKGNVSYTVYFYMEFSRPLEHFGVWKIDVPDDVFPVQHELATSYFYTDEYQQLVQGGVTLDGCRRQEGNHIGFFAEFPSLDASERLVVKSGISFVSIDGARKNLEHDIPGWDFDEVRRNGRSLWDDALSAIEIEGATLDQKSIFYTAMYHAMIDPHAISDVDGNYTGVDGKVHTAAKYTPRTVFSGWDVFRGEFPLMTLLNATMVNDEINSLVNLAEESGNGYLERWEFLNAYTGCMDGDPATSVILDAYSKGIRGFDVEKAYAACRQTAAGKNGATNRPENDFYMEHGTFQTAIPHLGFPGLWTTPTLTGVWDVWPRRLARHRTRNCFQTEPRITRGSTIRSVGTMRAKNASGEWIPWLGKTAFGQGCTESNPIQQTWFVPHDVAGLIALMGGEEEFARKLDDFFEKTPPTFGWNDYYNHSNEPVHHVPYLFVYAGKPWLTQKWVRRVLTGAYHNNVNGICGNDDVGQMSAWYVLGALGFYPVCPGDGTYILDSPLFSRATIHLDQKWYKDAKFTITADNQAPDHPYVQSASLNGRPLSRAWIRHSEIAAGGILEFVMGPNPNKQWATKSIDLPPSMSTSSGKV